ncbi:MAG: hypothetical protein ACLU3I_21495 [Acutalibacteraceae bacterium]
MYIRRFDPADADAVVRVSGLPPASPPALSMTRPSSRKWSPSRIARTS